MQGVLDTGMLQNNIGNCAYVIIWERWEDINLEQWLAELIKACVYLSTPSL